MKYLNLVSVFQISPSEIEGVLQQHPGVYCAGVVGIPHPESTNLVRAYVVKKPGYENITEEDIKNFVAGTFYFLHKTYEVQYTS